MKTGKFNKLLFLFLFVSLSLGFVGCNKYTLEDFTNSIITGYEPLERLYVEDQIRVGFTKLPGNDFAFDSRVLGRVAKGIASTENARFELGSEKIGKLDAKVKKIISSGISYNDLEKIVVNAKGIRIYYFPEGYNIYVKKAGEDEVKNKKVITEIVQVDTLSLAFNYKGVFAGGAELEKEIEKIEAGGKIEKKSDKSFEVIYVNRPVAFRSKKIRQDAIQEQGDRIIIYGKAIDPTTNKPIEGATVEARFSTGLFPVTTTTDAYGRYSLLVTPQGLAEIVALDKEKRIIGQKPFNPMSATYEYNFP